MISILVVDDDPRVVRVLRITLVALVGQLQAVLQHRDTAPQAGTDAAGEQLA